MVRKTHDQSREDRKAKSNKKPLPSEKSMGYVDLAERSITNIDQHGL